MPSITFSFEDLCTLVGKKLDEKELIWLLDCAKAELDSKLSTEITVKYNDTNQPYLWSPEGLARLFLGILGKEKGLREISITKGKETITYDKRLKKVRPYIACFIARGKKLDDYLLKQIIQLQEKLADNFGRKREKISIGVYPLKNVSFPVSFKAASPSDTFTPLGFHEPVTLRAALDSHPKGKDYGHLIRDETAYPVFVDSNKEILSLVPVINSEQTGRLVVGDDSLFFDCTGTDETAVHLVANIFAFALADRGFSIETMTIAYPDKKTQTPSLATRTVKFDESEVERLLGIKLKSNEIKDSLERMGYKYSAGSVTIPCYRNDIMHTVDIVEDVGIMHGYDEFEPLPMTTYTPGGLLPLQHTIDAHRMLWIGLGYQEVMSAVLSSKDILYGKMNMADFGTIEIENPVSLTYSCVRTWILPILLEMLSKNRHVEYPQRLMEQGLVTIRGKEIRDEQHLATLSAHSAATFTEMRQCVEMVLRNAHVTYTIEELDVDCFIPGRAAKVLVNKQEIGFFGEFHPAILERFGLLVPVVGCELNLSLLN